MTRSISLLVFATLLFVIASTGTAEGEVTNQNRLVLFESFLRPGCGLCQSAAPAIDQLAAEYAGQPVLFLEYNVDAAPYSRYGRWWAAYGGTGSVMLPIVMTNSGQQISNGPVNHYQTYRAMVEAERGRSPQAHLTAYYQRIDNRLQFDIQVTNLSNTVLSAWQNSATVHAVVYEEERIGLTGRYVRQTISTPISNDLLPSSTARFVLTTPEITGVDWQKIRTVVMVDYQPNANGPYDMLQAVIPTTTPDFSVQPNPMTFLVDNTTGQGNSLRLSFQGAAWLEWTASSIPPWMSIDPSTGSLINSPIASVATGSLTPGWQEGMVRFTATNSAGEQFHEDVSARVYYGTLEYLYLPIARK
jgi:thiol-disulfide isomerase/thioredoxin